jgi:two-component system phosphate regulon sensor histidine kinase PhoR
MPQSWIRNYRARVLLWGRYIWRRNAIWTRIILSLAIGTAFVLLDENSNYDLRFHIRGIQEVHPKIVLLEIDQNEWIDFHGRSRNLIRPLKEITSLTDSFFWNERSWHRLLSKVLSCDPLAVGVSFYFGENLSESNQNPTEKSVFSDDRVIWSASQDSEGRNLYPPFSQNFSQGTGLNRLRADEDGVIRHFSSSLVQIPHLTQRLASRLALRHSKEIQFIAGENYLINFQGKPGSYPRVSFGDIINGRVAPEFFRNKIVIIGGSDTEGHLYRTPVGELNRSEIMAELVDNIFNHRWIQKPARSSLFVYLLFILLVAIWIQFAYPQSVAFVFTVWLGTTTTAFSLWIFDTFYIWVPIQAVLVQLGAAYISFLSYHLSVKDNLNWRLEQEKIYFTQVDQMKHNFISLFSHDLKTPIAKIQAICDRLIATHFDSTLRKDLVSLRLESAELHKYIEKILQISRVESTDFKLRKEGSDINEIILQVIEQLKPLAIEKSIRLDTKLEPMFLIEIDSILIREVIINLVENAIKYTPSGGTVLIFSREENNVVQIIVTDTGVGIAPAEQSKVFGKFVRGQHQELLTKGTGLGLYLVKYFIELHGGSIRLESELGKGTSIEFSLPVENLDESEMLGLETHH